MKPGTVSLDRLTSLGTPSRTHASTTLNVAIRLLPNTTCGACRPGAGMAAACTTASNRPGRGPSPTDAPPMSAYASPASVRLARTYGAVPGAGRSHSGGCRSVAVTSCPASCNTGTADRPTLPRAPVTNTRIPFTPNPPEPVLQAELIGAGRDQPVHPGRHSGVPAPVALPPQTADLDLHHVAGTEVREPAGRANTLWRTGVHNITRVENGELRQVPQQPADPEDHVLCGGILPWLAVDPRAQRQVLRIRHFVRGDQPRPQRVERLAALAFGPLPAGPVVLELPFGQVVDNRVPGNAGERVSRRGKVTRPPPNDHTELDLPVAARRTARDEHVVVRADDG